jgi:hypothetical protein
MKKMKGAMAFMAVTLAAAWCFPAAAADFDGDGKDDIGIYRPSNGMWSIRDITRAYLGNSTDIPVPGKYASAARANIAVFRPSQGLWAILDLTRVYLGQEGDAPMCGIGGPPAIPFEVEGDCLGEVATFVNTHNTVNSYGILVQSGTSGESGSGDLIAFQNGAGAYLASIEFSGYNVVYNNFSGSHQASLPAEQAKEKLSYGTVMRLRESRSDPSRFGQADYVVEPSSKPYDKAVFGVYAGNAAKRQGFHNIIAVGDGYILVSKTGGDIEVGAYLARSGVRGHAMKQADDRLHGYTIAKAQEPVYWAKEKSDTKLIACTFHAQ